MNRLRRMARPVRQLQHGFAVGKAEGEGDVEARDVGREEEVAVGNEAEADEARQPQHDEERRARQMEVAPDVDQHQRDERQMADPCEDTERADHWRGRRRVRPSKTSETTTAARASSIPVAPMLPETAPPPPLRSKVGR